MARNEWLEQDFVELRSNGKMAMATTKSRPKTKAALQQSTRTADATDEELLLQYRSHGTREAFVELVHRYERELYNYLRRYLANGTLAEDAFQLTFLQVHLKCDQFEPGRRVRPWLYTIATNQAIDAQRRLKRHRMVSLDGVRDEDGQAGRLGDLLESGETNPTDQVETSERRSTVRQAVSQLPESLKSVVMLVYYQGMKYREAADVLKIPVGTVKSRLHTAIGKLNQSSILTAGDDQR